MTFVSIRVIQDLGYDQSFSGRNAYHRHIGQGVLSVRMLFALELSPRFLPKLLTNCSDPSQAATRPKIGTLQAS